jgi:hypothetical protein
MMNADSWNKIFNFYWEHLTRPDESDFCKKLCTVCLKPSIDLICSDEIATSELINYIDSRDGKLGWVGELTKLSEEYADLDTSYELFEELTRDVGYFKPKLPTNRHEWKNYSFDECPESDWLKTEIESVINKYLALNIRHPMLDRILLKAFADFEVCWTLRDITYEQYGGKSHLEQEEFDINPKGLRRFLKDESLYWMLASFVSLIYFTIADSNWGAGVVISVVLFIYFSNTVNFSVTNRLLGYLALPNFGNSSMSKYGPWHNIFEGEKLLYELAYHPGFISVERLYASFEEVAARGVAVDQDMWALLSDIKSRETILPNF